MRVIERTSCSCLEAEGLGLHGIMMCLKRIIIPGFKSGNVVGKGGALSVETL